MAKLLQLQTLLGLLKNFACVYDASRFKNNIRVAQWFPGGRHCADFPINSQTDVSRGHEIHFANLSTWMLFETEGGWSEKDIARM